MKIKIFIFTLLSIFFVSCNSGSEKCNAHDEHEHVDGDSHNSHDHDSHEGNEQE